MDAQTALQTALQEALGTHVRYGADAGRYVIALLRQQGYDVVALEHAGLSPRTQGVIELGDAYDQLREKTNFTDEQAFELVKIMLGQMVYLERQG